MESHARLYAGFAFVLVLVVLANLQTSSSTLAQDAVLVSATAESTAEAQTAAPPVDEVPPLMTQPADLLMAATDATGTTVLFPLPLATDAVDGPVGVACDWVSGAVFPLGSSVVTCNASDAAGNWSQVRFYVTVMDQSAPVIAYPADVVVTAVDSTGTQVLYVVPHAADNVDGAVGVGCDWGPGAFFPSGTTLVTCSATDAAGNVAAPVAFRVTVHPPLPPLPTLVPTAVPTQTLPPTPLPTVQPTMMPTATQPALPITEATQAVAVTETPSPTPEPTEAPELSPTATASPTLVEAGESTVVPAPVPTETLQGSPTESPDPTATPSPAPDVTPVPSPPPTIVDNLSSASASETPVPAMLDLPWPPPGNFVINTYGGPLNGIDAIWGYEDFPVSQEFGHTEFSIAHFSWYAYGIGYGLDGYAHPGLDVGMPAGTWLYSPVEGTVMISGNTPYYTYYGNGDPNVGELLILTDEGHEVILGHMGRISVNVGDRVSVGEFVGLSGGDNGDHLHLEVREIQWGGWHRAVDPRLSFIVDVLEAAAIPELDSAIVEEEAPPQATDAVEASFPPPVESEPRSALHRRHPSRESAA